MSTLHQESPPPNIPPAVLSRSEHPISRKDIDPDSLKVLYRLNRQGFKAFLVGGGVRDLLLGRSPKDFDVGTDATPEQVRALFRNCYLVGRRFRLAHVRFGKDKVIEVATFRRQASPEELPDDPAERFLVSENFFGSPQEDALRRDFTINGLFYDIEDFSIVDYVGGLEDLRSHRLRVIGDPLVRFVEDPVRMLRALEFSARLNFSLDEAARQAIYARASLIAEAAPARIREEIMELFRHRVAGTVLREAQAYGLLPYLMAGYEGDEQTFAMLDQIDAFTTSSGSAPSESFVLACLYLSRFRKMCPWDVEVPISEVLRSAGLVLEPHCNYFRIAHGVRHQARELLVAIYRFNQGRGRRGERRFLRHPSTPQALRLFSLWTQVSKEGQEINDLWQDALKDPDAPIQAGKGPKPSRRRPRRRPPRGRERRPS